MSGIAAYTWPDSASRLLRPGAFLRRWQPVHLHRVILDLRFARRQAHGLKLIQHYFPEELGEFGADGGWLDILRNLIKLAELENWFEPDWGTLDYLYECYMQIGDDDPADGIESDFLIAMGHFVEYIPVRHYNYDDEEWWNGIIERVPLLGLVRGLVDPMFEANISGLLIDYELYDVTSQAVDVYNLPQRCKRLEEPLCWLPVMVNFCRRETGNPLLDQTISMFDWDFPMWRWDNEEHLAEVKRLSVAAQAEWAKIEALLDWADGPEQIEEAVCVLADIEMRSEDNE